MKTLVNSKNNIRLILLAIVLTAIAIFYDNIKIYFSPSLLFIDRGITGPFSEVSYNPDGSIQANQITIPLQPGQSFYIVSTLCPVSQLGYTAIVRLVNSDTELTPEERHVYTRRRRWLPGERECRPLTAQFVIPENITGGVYTFERDISIPIFGRDLVYPITPLDVVVTSVATINNAGPKIDFESIDTATTE